MRTKILLMMILLSGIQNINAQSIEELQVVTTKVKDPFVKPEFLDRLMIGLRQYETSPVPGQDTLLMDIYKTISASYATNNHFKQALEVFNRYLSYKEKMLSNLKVQSVQKAMNSVFLKQQNDDNQQISLQNQLRQLQLDNEALESKRSSFKRNFSFFLIILSSIFAVMLVGVGIRMISLRSKLRQSQDRLKKIHSLSVLGNFEPGIRSSMRTSVLKIENDVKNLQTDLKKHEQNFPPAKQGMQIVSGIEKNLKEVLSVVSSQW